MKKILIAALMTFTVSQAFAATAGFMGDGTYVNSYVAGQHATAPIDQNYGVRYRGDNSEPNTYILGSQPNSAIERYSFHEVGRNAFNDGSAPNMN